MLEALKCWKRLKKQPDVDLTEKEYLHLMRCSTSTGDSLVMQHVLTDLAEEVPVPSKDTVAAIIEWFEITHSQHTKSLTTRQADSTLVKKLLEDIRKADTIPEPPPTMGPVVNTNGWRISSACHIDTETGAFTEGCLKGSRLKPVPLSDSAFQEMLKMNDAIVVDGKISGNESEFQGGRKGKKRDDFSPQTRQRDWSNFVGFLERKEKQSYPSPPFDVVIDGANVGYHKQNFQNAPRHVDYEQIDWVVRHFRDERNQRVLLVMHTRHFSPGLMPEKYTTLYESWKRDGILYRTPHGMNDDWFWMHAALKYKTVVLTNDEMRDHHFQMLAPRFFLRWKERQQVRFSFGSWRNKNNAQNEERLVELQYPNVYSRRIQRVSDGLVVPLAKRGDENRFLDGCHVACDDEPLEETYLCIRPRE
jgi:hypothetical protein